MVRPVYYVAHVLAALKRRNFELDAKEFKKRYSRDFSSVVDIEEIREFLEPLIPFYDLVQIISSCQEAGWKYLIIGENDEWFEVIWKDGTRSFLPEPSMHI